MTGDLGAGQPCPQGDCPQGDSCASVVMARVACVTTVGGLSTEVTACSVGTWWPGTGASPLDSSYCRTLQHGAAIERQDEKNAFLKHLAFHHQEKEGDVGAFSFTLEEVHSQPLSRLCSESVHIHHDPCQVPMNSKAEWSEWW